MKWKAFSVVEWRVVEDRGDHVVIEEVLRPDPNGPILIRDEGVMWASERKLLPKAALPTGDDAP